MTRLQAPCLARATALTGVMIVALTLWLGGCTAHPSGPYTPQPESARDSLKAQRLTQEAAAILDREPAKAERLLRDALTADLYHGPAHNDLGVLYLKQGKFYDAAGEFEWARKVMPGHPDPRVNLALVLERAGRTDDALASYRSALEVYPDYLPAVQGLARLQVKSGKTDDRTRAFLDDIAFRGETDRWKEWARTELARRRP